MRHSVLPSSSRTRANQTSDSAASFCDLLLQTFYVMLFCCLQRRNFGFKVVFLALARISNFVDHGLKMGRLLSDLKVSRLLRHGVKAVFNLPTQLRLVLISALHQCGVQQFLDGRRGNPLGASALSISLNVAARISRST